MSFEKDLARVDTSPSVMEGESVAIDDDKTLAALGYTHTLHRNISFGSILAAGWNACNSWAGLSVTLVTAITQGGTVTVLYGEIIMLLMIGATALSVAELASSFPTAGGQYHYSSILASKKYSRGLSYITGTVNILAWIVTTASVNLTIPQLIVSLVVNFNPTYVLQQWHIFILYEVVNVLMMLFNIYGLHHFTRLCHRSGFVLSISLFFATLIACVVRSSPKASNTFVWATFTNESGWSSSGLVFLTGLINPNFMFVGIDCAIHLAEECTNAAIAVPRAVLSVVVIGFLTAFPFAIAMFYSITDLQALLDTKTGQPIYQLWLQATRSVAGGTTLLLALIIVQFFALNACQQTASRLTWALGRDNALFFSKSIGSLNHSGVPAMALVCNATAIALIGILYVASTTAFNSIVGTCLILVQASYAIPCAILMLRGRRGLLPHRSVRLGTFGWLVNAITVLWGLENLVVYCLPFEYPVHSSNMNYAVVVLVIMAILASINWAFFACKYFQGPRIEIEVPTQTTK